MGSAGQQRVVAEKGLRDQGYLPTAYAADYGRIVYSLVSHRVDSFLRVVPKRGLEPPRGCPHMVLNHARLPFRHFGTFRAISARPSSPYRPDRLINLPRPFLEIKSFLNNREKRVISNPKRIVFFIPCFPFPFHLDEILQFYSILDQSIWNCFYSTLHI